MKKLIIVLALFFTFEAKAQYTIELASDSISNSQFRIAGAYTVPQDWVIDSVHIVMNAKSPTNITRLVLKRGIKLGSDKFVYITQVGDSLTATGMVITANDSTQSFTQGDFN